MAEKKLYNDVELKNTHQQAFNIDRMKGLIIT